MNWDRVISIINALGIFLTAGSIYLASESFHKDHERSRKQTAYELLKEAHNYLRADRETLLAGFNDFYSLDARHNISKEEANRLYKSCYANTNSFDQSLCDRMKLAAYYLNHLEDIAIGYVTYIADRDMINKSNVTRIIISDYDYFKELIDVAKTDNRGWNYLQDCVNIIKLSDSGALPVVKKIDEL
ncbi:hypothetical protein QLH52_24105 [Methylomonas sp. OY6]|uniref:Uncharacterized protein n=1 Tax=Methylomonas defluvii TaxID=3045149 RepID=A0ABU4ULM1_9GAMM|nr:hypothetical protein [Methylomonas sp. OY6]MDX8130396.1 hypothetical protein [Methylomonas sp. OY6]